MVAGLPNVERRLPDGSNMDRDDALDAFLAVLNVCEPDHPYQDEADAYPASRDEIDYGYCTSYYGKCGPRRGRYVASYHSNMKYVNAWSAERHLAMLTHEVTHVTECSGYREGQHPPAFWREFAFNTHLICDRQPELVDVFGNWSVETYINKILDCEVNPTNLDLRRTSVEEKRAEMKTLLPEANDHTPLSAQQVRQPVAGGSND